MSNKLLCQANQTIPLQDLNLIKEAYVKKMNIIQIDSMMEIYGRNLISNRFKRITRTPNITHSPLLPAPQCRNRPPLPILKSIS